MSCAFWACNKLSRYIYFEKIELNLLSCAFWADDGWLEAGDGQERDHPSKNIIFYERRCAMMSVENWRQHVRRWGLSRLDARVHNTSSRLPYLAGASFGNARRVATRDRHASKNDPHACRTSARCSPNMTHACPHMACACCMRLIFHTCHLRLSHAWMTALTGHFGRRSSARSGMIPVSFQKFDWDDPTGTYMK